MNLLLISGFWFTGIYLDCYGFILGRAYSLFLLIYI